MKRGVHSRFEFPLPGAWFCIDLWTLGLEVEVLEKEKQTNKQTNTLYCKWNINYTVHWFENEI